MEAVVGKTGMITAGSGDRRGRVPIAKRVGGGEKNRRRRRRRDRLRRRPSFEGAWT